MDMRQTPYQLSISYLISVRSGNDDGLDCDKNRRNSAFGRDFVTGLTFYAKEVLWWCQGGFFYLQIFFCLEFVRFFLIRMSDDERGRLFRLAMDDFAR
jgi:hypothetical protein